MEKGEIKALYEKYGGVLFNRALGILKNHELAEEALQDVFVNVIKYAHTFKNESSPYTWLYKITTNCSLNLLKQKKRADPLESAYDMGETNKKIPLIEMQGLLKKLEDDAQKIFIHHYINQSGQDEIADLLGISRKTVYNKLGELKEKLKKILGENP